MWTLFLLDRENRLTLKHRNPMIFIVFKCQNSSLDYADADKKFIEKLMEQSIMTKLLMKARKNNPIILNIGHTRWRNTSSALRIGRLKKWVSVLATGGGQKKRIQYCLNPNYPHQFLYLRAIQGHSGSTINLALQYNVQLPEGFTEYIYHVGNGKELRSIVNHGLIPGGVSLETGRHAVFFTVVNPMDNQDGLGETVCDLSRARIAPCKNILGNAFRKQYFGATWRWLNKEDCNFIKKIKRNWSIRHIACRVH